MSIAEAPTGDSPVAARFYVGVRALLVLPLLLLATFCLAPEIAQAHGGGPALGYDPCLRQAGADDFVHLAVYQPDFNPFAEYCSTLPNAGRTVLVFDLMGTALPGARIGLEVLQQGGQFQLSRPARRYYTGVADFGADLPAGT